MTRRRHASATFSACCLLACSALAAGAQLPQSPAVRAVQSDLNRAADALLALKSARFVLKREGTPAILDEISGITFTAADCLYAAPDRVLCNVKVALKNGTILQLTRVWVPEGTFQSNPLTRQFAKLPPDASFNGSVLFARSGIPQLLRTSIQKPQLVGKERIQNRDTVHLKGDVSGEKLNPLMGALSPDLTYPVDLWIDETTALLVQLHIREPSNNGWQIELSGANDPVDIPTPQLPPPIDRR